MTSNEKKDKIQRQAIDAWLEVNKAGTCEIITGLGKTFIGLHALYTMPKNEDLHLFLAETVDREQDLMNDILKYNKIFGRDVLRDYNLKFYCYQSAYKWRGKTFGLVIADEIHDSLSLEYSKFYQFNNYKAIMGLSATVQLNTRYELEGGGYTTKKEILDRVAPICYSYGLKQAKNEGTSRKLDIYVINHKLDSTEKYVPGGSAKSRFYQTEAAAYDYWDKAHKKSFFIMDEEMKRLKIRITSTRRSNILYNLKSKTKIVRKLLDSLDTKTIIFGNSLDALLKVTPNVVSSRNSDDENKRIRAAFDKGLIRTIGSFKKLKQGANLVGLDNAILMSYYSTNLDLIQRVGRLRDNGKIGNIFIIVTQSTQEEVWFSKMIENISDFNIIYCPDIEFCLKKLKEN